MEPPVVPNGEVYADDEDIADIVLSDMDEFASRSFRQVEHINAEEVLSSLVAMLSAFCFSLKILDWLTNPYLSASTISRWPSTTWSCWCARTNVPSHVALSTSRRHHSTAQHRNTHRVGALILSHPQDEMTLVGPCRTPTVHWSPKGEAVGGTTARTCHMHDALFSTWYESVTRITTTTRDAKDDQPKNWRATTQELNTRTRLMHPPRRRREVRQSGVRLPQSTSEVSTQSRTRVTHQSVGSQVTARSSIFWSARAPGELSAASEHVPATPPNTRTTHPGSARAGNMWCGTAQYFVYTSESSIQSSEQSVFTVLHHPESIRHWQSGRIFHLLLLLNQSSMSMFICSSCVRVHLHPFKSIRTSVKMSFRECHSFVPNLQTIQKNSNHHSIHGNSSHRSIRHHSIHRQDVSVVPPPCLQRVLPRYGNNIIHDSWEPWMLCASAAAQTPGFALSCPRSCPSARTWDQSLSSWFPSAAQRPTPTSSQPRPFASLGLGVSFRTWAVARLLIAHTASARPDSAANWARNENSSCWSWVTTCSIVINIAPPQDEFPQALLLRVTAQQATKIQQRRSTKRLHSSELIGRLSTTQTTNRATITLRSPRAHCATSHVTSPITTPPRLKDMTPWIVFLSLWRSERQCLWWVRNDQDYELEATVFVCTLSLSTTNVDFNTPSHVVCMFNGRFVSQIAEWSTKLKQLNVQPQVGPEKTVCSLCHHRAFMGTASFRQLGSQPVHKISCCVWPLHLGLDFLCNYCHDPFVVSRCSNLSAIRWFHSACTSVSMFTINVDNSLILCCCFLVITSSVCAHIGFLSMSVLQSFTRSIIGFVNHHLSGVWDPWSVEYQSCKTCNVVVVLTEAETGFIPTSAQFFAVSTFLTLRSSSWTHCTSLQSTACQCASFAVLFPIGPSKNSPSKCQFIFQSSLEFPDHGT